MWSSSSAVQFWASIRSGLRSHASCQPKSPYVPRSAHSIFFPVEISSTLSQCCLYARIVLISLTLLPVLSH
ncbi:hypothetical protein M569_00130 [Genlisea aurea]|uniref:Uncharacterized protein n=1 Tax=Genlisea aurea TaxID=192259 RepID=S8DAV8_9LAMI|nr:hypothetical protein M569_00130 [Genlisea aurea]